MDPIHRIIYRISLGVIRKLKHCYKYNHRRPPQNFCYGAIKKDKEPSALCLFCLAHLTKICFYFLFFYYIFFYSSSYIERLVSFAKPRQQRDPIVFRRAPFCTLKNTSRGTALPTHHAATTQTN